MNFGSITPEVAERIGLKSEPGWLGVFTRESYAGAFPNGTRVQKTESKSGDENPNGTVGKVLGSICFPEYDPTIGYFVEWETSPKKAVFVIGSRIERA